MIAIGSQALKYWDCTVKPNDLDLVGTYDEAVEFRKSFGAVSFYPINSGKSIYMKNKAGEICEIEIAWSGSRAERLVEFVETDVGSVEVLYPLWEMVVIVPSINVLYMLKMSHRYLKDSPHFLKTMNDIKKFREMGAVIEGRHQSFYEQRMKDTYTYAMPKLNQSKEGFFDALATGLEYEFDHDSLHEAVKIQEHPAYWYFKPQDSQVMVSKAMWDGLHIYTKWCAVLEESYVLALERSLIPYPFGLTPKQAFDMALMKVCTSITGGWFREFAWESYNDIQALYDESYVDKFQQGIANGVVKPFDNSKSSM